MKNPRLGTKLIVLSMLVCTFLVHTGFAQDSKEASATQHEATGQEVHAINLEEANAYIDAFRATAETDEPLGGAIRTEAVLKILSQEGAAGLRYYYGRNEEGKRVLVLLGIDGNGEDMWDGHLAERTFLCPPMCCPWVCDESELVATEEEEE